MPHKNNQQLLQGAVKTGLINAVINAAIQYFLLRDKTPIAISVDSITNQEHTVLGAAVMLAVSLAMILTAIAYLLVKKPRPNFFPYGFWLVLKHGFFTFGVVTALAVLWQRWFGSIEVSLSLALLMIGLIAGLVAGVVEYLTIHACQERSQKT